MNQEKISEFIKKIRKDNNLTQKDLADKYGVTYQAVSKWENAKNIPDIAILKQMSIDYNISIDDLLEGSLRKKKRLFKYINVIIILFLIIAIIFLLFNNKKYSFKTISANCPQFEVTGSIAYDDKTSSISIFNINYCGGDDETVYKEIECNLYEKNDDINKKISSCRSDNSNIKLEDYLKDVKLNIDNYAKTCKKYNDESLYLEINAKDSNDKITTYKIPLSLNNNCPN